MKPRLQEKYEQEVLPQLAESLGRTNRLQLPRLQKITVNMGVGTAVQEKKHLELADASPQYLKAIDLRDCRLYNASYGAIERLDENPSGLDVARDCLEQRSPVMIISQGKRHRGNLGAVRDGL